ncbi:MAG: YraN family protein [Patescibacteria group bacterium]|nr:YraN family protein [Patescibacteria group bacterium]
MKKFTSNSQIIGKLGEDIACKFLMKHGYSVKERNYTKKWGEIDIIAEKDSKIYFVEVKSVSCETLPDFKKDNLFTKRPEENMHPWKMKRLSRTIQTYLIHKRIGNTPWQFDLLLVYLDIKNRLARVKTIENVIL